MISYDDAAYSVRGDFAAAHSRYWSRLQSPGAWFTSAQRIAIARAVRLASNCQLCRDRKDALSPRAVSGDHDLDAGNQLRAEIIEAVHCIATDASRLTQAWYQDLLDQGLTEGEYIEIVGTVVAMVSIDCFASAIGVDHRALPKPGAGSPSHYSPVSAHLTDQAWVPMVDINNAGTPEQDLWASENAPNVIRALSLVPDEVRTLKDLSGVHYLSAHYVQQPGANGGRALSRTQMELLAGRISALNQCYY